MKNIILTLLLITASIAIIGCESEIDDNFVPFSEREIGYHPFTEPAADNHAAFMDSIDYDFNQCVACHGENLNNPESRSCYNCHNDDNHIVFFSDAEDDHPGYLQTHSWDIASCMNCHNAGQDFIPEAIFFGPACQTCHNSPTGVDACNTCHGDNSSAYDNVINWAPPEDLAGNSSTSFIGVGAHRAHLDNNGIWKPVPCNACHNVPSSWSSPGHIDSSLPVQANLTFHSIGPNDNSNPNWNHNSASCGSTYCHFDSNPVWTEVNDTWNQCGMCHSLPPAPPHPQDSDCDDCHDNYDNGEIVDQALHANGYVDFD